MAKSSGIGGQAVIEGIMMRNGERYSVAVRKPDKEICVIEKDYNSSAKAHPFLNIPLVRGVAAFVDSLRVGMSTLTYSSSFYEDDEEEDKISEAAQKIFKDKKKADSAITVITVFFSVIMAAVLFLLTPYGVSRLFGNVVKSTFALNVIEGVTRLLIFVIYVLLISQMQDIKRVFMYHGAEHKSINCIEQGYPLTLENVKKASRFHKRCGTSFMVFVMILSIIIFIFIQTKYRWLNLLLRFALVPLIAGIAYEILKFAGNHNGAIVDILSAPGVLMQTLTVKEPDDDMIEVAIAAVEQVFDWQEYLDKIERDAEREERVRKRREARILDKVETFDLDEDNDDENEGFVSSSYGDDDGIEFLDLDSIDNINSIDDINEIFEKQEDDDPYLNVKEYVVDNSPKKNRKKKRR